MVTAKHNMTIKDSATIAGDLKNEDLTEERFNGIGESSLFQTDFLKIFRRRYSLPGQAREIRHSLKGVR